MYKLKPGFHVCRRFARKYEFGGKCKLGQNWNLQINVKVSQKWKLANISNINVWPFSFLFVRRRLEPSNVTS